MIHWLKKLMCKHTNRRADYAEALGGWSESGPVLERVWWRPSVKWTCLDCGHSECFPDDWRLFRDDWEAEGQRFIDGVAADWEARGGRLSEQVKQQVTQ